jgi:Na+/melibiose symporter-like transporter
MITTDMGRTAIFTLIAVVVASGNMTLTLLYVCVFAVGLCETLFDTAAMSITPAIVGTAQLDSANSRLDSAQVAANELAGPALGGALFAAAAALPFGVNAATFAASVALLLSVGGSFRPVARARPSILHDVSDGFTFLWSQPGIRAFAIGAGLINLGHTAAISLLVLHAEDNLGLGDVGFGVLLAASAAGGILGSVAAPRIIGWLGRRNSVLVAVILLAGGMATAGAARAAWLTGCGLALVAFAGGVWNIVSVTHRQSVTPDALLGRVMSGFRVIAYGTFPIGAALGGWIAGLASVRATFYFGSALIAILFPLLLVLLPGEGLDPLKTETLPPNG